MPDQPLLSIVTPSLNNVNYIEKAILSVINQDHPCVEHIIVDGGSTDGTLEVISRFGHLILVNEQDQKGVYHANNIGIEQAKGEFIGILNSDDYYSENIFGKIIGIFQSEQADVVSGGAEFFHQDGAKPPYQWLPDINGDALTQALGVPLVNACFFRSDVIKMMNGFDPGYRLAGDREFMIRLASRGICLRPLEEILYHYRLHINALTSNPYDQWHITSRLERMDIIEEYLGGSLFGPGDRDKLRRWHGLNSAWLVRASLAEHKPGLAIKNAFRSWRYRSGWQGSYTRLFIAPHKQIITDMMYRLRNLINRH